MLNVRDLHVEFGSKPILRGVDLHVSQGEIVCLLGPSGCGKTTLLRVVAGLEQAARGEVRVDEQPIQQVPVNERGFGLMFQDFALFPHMTVAQNVAFGLEMQGRSAHERQARVSEVLRLVNLTGFEGRDVTRLSGGERQRVALARSLAPAPRLLMLDEPLGSLDAALREQLVVELRTIIKQVGLTAIHVTHDQREAYAIADRIAVMNQGLIEQIDTPAAIYQQPTTHFVARFLGLHNLVPVLRWQAGMAETALGRFPVAQQSPYLLLHPDHLHPLTTESTTAPIVTGQITEVVFLGESYRVRLRHSSGQELALRIATTAALIPQLGQALTVTVGQALPVS
jgi:ABC-type Fe3+/spermidine/putrescine transport system ATPase subunit